MLGLQLLRRIVRPLVAPAETSRAEPTTAERTIAVRLRPDRREELLEQARRQAESRIDYVAGFQQIANKVYRGGKPRGERV